MGGHVPARFGCVLFDVDRLNFLSLLLFVVICETRILSIYQIEDNQSRSVSRFEVAASPRLDPIANRYVSDLHHRLQPHPCRNHSGFSHLSVKLSRSSFHSRYTYPSDSFDFICLGYLRVVCDPQLILCKVILCKLIVGAPISYPGSTENGRALARYTGSCCTLT